MRPVTEIVKTMRRRLRRTTRVFTSPIVAAQEAFHPSVARAFPALPGPARRALFLAASLAAVTIVPIAWLNPAWLNPSALLVAAAVLAASVLIGWSSRFVRHRRAGLPPGGPTRGWSLIIDPDHYRDRWQRLGPVFQTGFAGRPQACMAGLERGADLLADETSIGRDEMERLRGDAGAVVERTGERADADAVVEGHTIPFGCPVRVLVAESHRDPAIFENPDEYRPERFIGRRYDRREYAPFGVNDRTCVGEQLSRFVSRRWVLALCARHQVIVTADGRRAYSAQRHWAPSSKFRIRLEGARGNWLTDQPQSRRIGTDWYLSAPRKSTPAPGCRRLRRNTSRDR